MTVAMLYIASHASTSLTALAAIKAMRKSFLVSLNPTL